MSYYHVAEYKGREYRVWNNASLVCKSPNFRDVVDFLKFTAQYDKEIQIIDVNLEPPLAEGIEALVAKLRLGR